MDAKGELLEKDLYALYGDYVAAHSTRLVADQFAADGRVDDAERWQRMADDRLANVIGDMDALEINVYIASRLHQERLKIVERLRAVSKPASWSTIGHALGMTKQAAHEWFHRGYQRPKIPTPPTPTRPEDPRRSAVRVCRRV
jgi:hypothetical protein